MLTSKEALQSMGVGQSLRALPFQAPLYTSKNSVSSHRISVKSGSDQKKLRLIDVVYFTKVLSALTYSVTWQCQTSMSDKSFSCYIFRYRGTSLCEPIF